MATSLLPLVWTGVSFFISYDSLFSIVWTAISTIVQFLLLLVCDMSFAGFTSIAFTNPLCGTIAIPIFPGNCHIFSAALFSAKEKKIMDFATFTGYADDHDSALLCLAK
jgi:hypothetical protein